jgi:hypothetical protein
MNSVLRYGSPRSLILSKLEAAAGARLLWDDSEEGSKLPPGTEAARISDGCNHGRGREQLQRGRFPTTLHHCIRLRRLEEGGIHFN